MKNAKLDTIKHGIENNLNDYFLIKTEVTICYNATFSESHM